MKKYPIRLVARQLRLIIYHQNCYEKNVCVFWLNGQKMFRSRNKLSYLIWTERAFFRINICIFDCSPNISTSEQMRSKHMIWGCGWRRSEKKTETWTRGKLERMTEIAINMEPLMMAFGCVKLHESHLIPNPKCIWTPKCSPYRKALSSKSIRFFFSLISFFGLHIFHLRKISHWF